MTTRSSEYTRRVNDAGTYRTNPRNSGSNRRTHDAYVYGNTARALRPVEQEVRSPRKVNSNARKGTDKETSMNPGFMLFLVAAMVVTGFVCMQYIQLQSSVTMHADKVSSMEMELEELSASNDDYESRIKGAIELEDIKKRAMDDLGMTYAKDDQIVEYDSDGTDYVRQYVSLE